MEPTRCWQLVRSSGLSPNPNEVARRASSFAAAAESLGAVTLLTMRDKSSLASYMVAPARSSADQAVLHLAQAVAAQAKELDTIPDMVRPTYGTLVAKSKSATTRDSQIGSDPAEVARRLLVSMRPGSWVAASVRKPSGSELRRVRRWYAFRLGNDVPVHHSTEDNAVIMSLTAAGADADEVRATLGQVAAALPGFDVETSVHIVSAGKTMVPWLGISAAAWGGMIYGTGDPLLATAAGVPPALIGLGVGARKLPSGSRTLDREIGDGTLASPKRRIAPPKKPMTGTSNPQPGSRNVDPHPGGYPLAEESFLIGPSVIVGLVAPHAGSSSGAATTERRSAPSSLLERIGPAVGSAGDADAMVHLSAADEWAGVALVGQAGSGKTQAMRCLFGWHCLERSTPSGIPGWPGTRNALVVFESKGGDDAKVYERWSDVAGDRTLLVEFADPDSWGIDILSVPGSNAQRAEFVANAMVYAFEAGAVGPRSFEAIVILLTAALSVTDEIAAEAGLPGGMSPFWYTHVLVAGQGDAKAVALAEAISGAALVAEKAAGSRSLPSGEEPTGPQLPLTELGVADARLATYFSGKNTEASRRTHFEAPRNKLAQLITAEEWWSPQRRKVTWEQILDGHKSVIINTGTAQNGDRVGGQLKRHMSSLLMYALQDAISRLCAGWQDQQRSVTVFADELALVAKDSAEVITWLRNQGRSYGVRPIFATQYPEQLIPEIRDSFLGFSTIFWFAQGNPMIAAAAAQDLALDGSEWVAADIANLEPFVAVLRTSVGAKRQPAVPVKLGYWEADMASYPGIQGFVPVAPTTR